MKKLSLSPSVFLVIILISFAVSPAFAFSEDNRNILLIGVMLFSPLIILFYRKFDKNDFILVLFIASILLFPFLLYYDGTRWSTVLYSVMFCLTFIAFKQLLRRSYFTIVDYEKLLKYLLYAYFIVLIIQQLAVLTGLPILNVRFYNPTEPWKLNSLGAEPSWSGRTIGLLMYCYLTIKELMIGRKYNFRINFRSDKWLWIGFFYSMLTLGSATALLFIFLVLSKFVRFRSIIQLTGLVIFSSILLNVFEISSAQRVIKVVTATITLNEEAIVEADHSASFRIVPTIVLAKKLNLSTIEGWFGYGVDYISKNIDLEIPGSANMSAGGLFTLFIEYGFISFILFTVFSLFTTINNKEVFQTGLFWFFMIFLYGLNVQIPWIAMMLLYANKYFQKN